MECDFTSLVILSMFFTLDAIASSLFLGFEESVRHQVRFSDISCADIIGKQRRGVDSVVWGRHHSPVLPGIRPSGDEPLRVALDVLELHSLLGVESTGSAVGYSEVESGHWWNMEGFIDAESSVLHNEGE
jgi:hypothetical protein